MSKTKLTAIRVIIAVAAAGCILSASTVGTFANSLGDRLQLVKAGLTKEATTAIMGREPDSQTDTKTFGVEWLKLKWHEGQQTFVVRLLGAHRIDARVISVKTCVGAGDC